MIKKINKYLLENHPLVWNARLIWLLLLLVVMHIGFFIVGFFSYFSPVDLHMTDLYEKYLTSGFVWIGILLSILIFILWMNQYFKQNAFKSHYPKSNLSLYKEFLIIFLISILGITQYFSYTCGLQTHVSGLKSTEKIEKEIDLINRVAPFTLQNQSYRYDGYYTSYDHNNRCLDVPVFDSLVPREEVLKLYVENQIRQGIWPNVKAENYLNYKDSLNQSIYHHNEYQQVLIKHFPERENWKDSTVYSTNEVYNVYGDSNEAVMTAEVAAPNMKYSAATPETVSYNLNSIYNYCGVAVYAFDSLKNREYYAKETHKLLKGNQKAAIQDLMNNYQKLADEYEVGYRFKDKNWIDYVYNPPYYFVDHELTTVSRYSEAHGENFKKDYIAQADMENTLQNLKKSKSSVFESYSYLIFLYIALVITLLIYTFRITSMRVWVISLVGSIVLIFVYYCLFFLFGMTLFSLNETTAAILFLLFILAFFILSYSGIFTGKRKLISGVNFNWSIWSFPSLVPICFLLYNSYLEWKYPYNYENALTQHPHKIWIDDSWELIFYYNLILVFIFILLIIPIIKKWKAMPEE